MQFRIATGKLKTCSNVPPSMTTENFRFSVVIDRLVHVVDNRRFLIVGGVDRNDVPRTEAAQEIFGIAVLSHGVDVGVGSPDAMFAEHQVQRTMIDKKVKPSQCGSAIEIDASIAREKQELS